MKGTWLQPAPDLVCAPERDEQDLKLATHRADVLVGRAVREGSHACWRFLEHHEPEPLLPPGTGWMQGAAGISAYLLHISRVARDPVARMDNWWALGEAGRRGRPTNDLAAPELPMVHPGRWEAD